MNEKIRQFAKESHIDVYALGKDYAKWEAVVEKFTELIIKECTNVVENVSPGYDDYRNQIEDAFRRDCVSELKKHFGVE